MAGAKEIYRQQYLEALAVYGESQLIIAVHTAKSEKIVDQLTSMRAVLDKMPDDEPDKEKEDGVPK